MTNREVYEDAAGMGLCQEFFAIKGIDPNAEYTEVQTATSEITKSLCLDCKYNWVL